MVRFDIIARCHSKEQCNQISTQVINIISCKDSLNAIQTNSIDDLYLIRIKEDIGVFPGITYTYSDYHYNNGPADKDTEIIIKCNSKDDAKIVGNFMHYQFSGIDAYVNNDIVINVTKNIVTLVIDKKVSIMPQFIFIRDDYLQHIK